MMRLRSRMEAQKEIEQKNEQEKEYTESTRKFAGNAKSTFITAWKSISSVLEEWFGIDANTARSTMLISIIPICLFVGQIASYIYFWAHYFLIYKVPMAYFIIDDSLLTKFTTGIWITLIVIVGILFVYYFEVIRPYIREISTGVAVMMAIYLFAAWNSSLLPYNSVWWLTLAFVFVIGTVLLFASCIKCAPFEIEKNLLNIDNKSVEEVVDVVQVKVEKQESLILQIFMRVVFVASITLSFYLFFLSYRSIAILDFAFSDFYFYAYATVWVVIFLVELILFCEISRNEIKMLLETGKTRAKTFALDCVVFGLLFLPISYWLVLGFQTISLDQFLSCLYGEEQIIKSAESILLTVNFEYPLVCLLFNAVFAKAFTFILHRMRNNIILLYLRNMIASVFNKAGRIGKKVISWLPAVVLILIPLCVLLFFSFETYTLLQPYAITEDETYAVIYQTSKYSILEEIDIDEETNTLTLYTGKQKMEDSFVAYKYQSFDIVHFNSD